MDPWETKPADDEKTSVWKKEISFRRKPKPAGSRLKPALARRS